MIKDLAQANQILKRIQAVASGALDPELTRVQVVARVKEIYALAVTGEEEDEEDDNE